MTQSTKPAMSLAMLLLAVGFCLGLIIDTPSTATAQSPHLAYKVAVFDDFHSAEDYENFLNEMARQGWQFDHVIQMTDKVVFRRAE